MQSLTDTAPKPMLEAHGRPILAHLVSHLRRAGVAQILIVTGYRAEQVENYFANQPGIVFRRQAHPDGTARAALLAQDFIDRDPFLLTYGDILAAPGTYLGMAERLEGAETVVAVKRVDDPCQGAAVYAEGDRVTCVIEKPPPGTSTTPFNSAGIYGFEPSIFHRLEEVRLSPRGEYELTDAVSAVVASGALARLYEIAGWWADIGRPEDLARIPAAMSSE